MDPTALETMPCPMCQSRSIALREMVENADPATRGYFPAIGLATCGECGLVHQNPRIPKAVMAELYRTINDKSFASPRSENPATRAENARRMAMINAHLPGGLAGKRLLEVGSSNGAFLELAREQGAEVCGIEPSAENAEICRGERGIQVFNGFVEEYTATGDFDVVCHYFVLEHAFDPAGFMRKIRALLNPNGRLFFEVPAIESFLEMPFAINLFPYQHISHFDHRSIRHLMAGTDFTPLAVEGARACSKAYGMSVVARPGSGAAESFDTGPQYGAGLLREYAERKSRNESLLTERVERFLEKHQRPVTAVYGAGENGRLLLRITRARSLASRLLFFDNSPAFIGTEIEGCPVYAPSSLPDLGVDVAILASVDYQEDMERDLVARGFPEDRILRAYPAKP